MIRRCNETDLPDMFEIINDAATAYRGRIPADLWHEPYMPLDELRQEIEAGVAFWGYEEAGQLLGVMGIQDKGPVTLIRHAYVRTRSRNSGIGGRLLTHLRALTSKPVLIGTWVDAVWAVSFYQKHGFQLQPEPERTELLERFWSITPRHAAVSVVLADPVWLQRQNLLRRSS